MSAVAFENVTLSYGGRRVLCDVSFSIPQGAFVGLLGANGAGKTTMLCAILGLIRPVSGTISVLGAPPKRGNPAKRLRHGCRRRRRPPLGLAGRFGRREAGGL